MNWSAKTVFGMILLLIGVSIVLQLIGISIGYLLRMIIPILLIIYGYKKWNLAETKFQKFFGMIVLLFGVLLLLGAAHLFIGLIVAGLIMYFGYSIMKGKQDDSVVKNDPIEVKGQRESKDLFDEEWDRFMNEYKTK
ncbi:LiaF transmembrane domain-containing protein [Anaerobacillus sp. MEB173]|uniref:LiaF transmembrane domain-containing protein n=1 Tax=Anaerobacillus sp. MEB173 TaxID=3383345 RepID=UPI003F93B522